MMKRSSPVLFALLAMLTARVCRADDDSTQAVLDRHPEWQTDEKAHMIAIEVLIVEVNEEKTRDLGLKYGYARTDVEKIVEGADVVLGSPLAPVQLPAFSSDALGQTKVGFTNHLPGLGVNLVGMDVGGGVVSARLRALLDQGQARVTARPIVLALHDSEALISVGSEMPYQDFNVVAGYITMPDVKFETVGIKMQIKPRIIDLKAQSVELNITNIEIGSVSNFITTQNVDRPVFNKADTRTKVTLKAGETFQISGLKAERKSSVREGIPYLMDIPLMGALFSSRKEVASGVDILFFVTPHIIPPGQNMLVPFDFINGSDLLAEGVKTQTQ